MRRNKFLSVVAVCILVLNCLFISVAAVEAPDNDSPILRVSEHISQTISAKTTAIMDEGFSLEKGDTVSYNCTYTPKSASVDFGYVAPDGLFYSLNSTSGSINKSIRVNQTGEYMLAIRNNENYAVTVSGTVKY